jgi:sulfur-oxidizing protein SoxA
MRTTYRMAVAAAVLALAAIPALAQTKHDYWYTIDNPIVPHFTGDRHFSNTVDNWKDADSIRRAKAAGFQSRDVNFKDFRWLEKSFDAMLLVDEARDIFHKPQANGSSCASCHGKDGAKLKGVYPRLPSFNARLGRVVSGPTQIKSCAKERLGLDWPENSRSNSLLDLYVAWLSDGEPVAIDVTTTGPLKDSYERGKLLYFKRTGHFHFACASCHTGSTTSLYIRGQRPSTFFGDAAHYPIWHFGFALPGDDNAAIFTLQHQIKSCQTLSRMLPGTEGSVSMTDIEVFLKASANGYPMSIPTVQYNMSTDYLQKTGTAPAR